ncbi:hypothetical protein ES703_63602 [subsurface metagenome]
MNKRGISPVIATVLLIAMVVVIGLIVFLWFRGMIEEEATKFEKNIKLNCPDVNFDASYSGGFLSILNSGNVPIYKMKVKIFKEGSHETKDLNVLSGNWPGLGLNKGGTFSDIISEIEGADKIILIPVLMGSSREEKKSYVCEEQYGLERIIK